MKTIQGPQWPTLCYANNKEQAGESCFKNELWKHFIDKAENIAAIYTLVLETINVRAVSSGCLYKVTEFS